MLAGQTQPNALSSYRAMSFLEVFMRFLILFAAFALGCGAAPQAPAPSSLSAGEQAQHQGTTLASANAQQGATHASTAKAQGSECGSHGEKSAECEGKNCDCKGSCGDKECSGENCDCKGDCGGTDCGCDKAKQAGAHANTEGAPTADHAACTCSAGKSGGTTWCDACNMGYIKGESTTDQAKVQEALKSGA